MVPEQYAKPESIRDLAKRLASLGYYPVPIPAGCKGPTIAGWDKLRLTPEDCDAYFPERGALVGVLHVNLLAIDIDVYDAQLSETITAEALKRFPAVLERVGQAPKSALFFRMDEPGFKVGNTEKHEKDGLSAQVEVRSVSRQIVAYGVHPDTGRPYTWPRGELWATPRDSLPMANREDIEKFRDWCNDQIRKWAGVTAPNIIDLGLHQKGQFADERPSGEAFREALSYVPPTAQYDDWLSTLMAIHDFYNGSSEGLGVAQEWSSPYPQYTPQEVQTKWRSFEPGKGTSYRTVFYLAKMNGADLSELARKHNPKPERAVERAANDWTPPQSAEQSELEWFDDVQVSTQSNYLIKDFLDQETVSVVYGPSNSGKTFFVLDMAYHMAAGIDWRGRQVRKAAVLYIAAEGGRGIKARIVGLRQHTGASGIPFALRRGGLDLLRSEADLTRIVGFAKEIAERAPDLPLVIVIDTLSRVMAGGDENGPVDMTQFVANMDALRATTGAHICIVHHSGKDAAKGARGHSSLRAAVDTEIEIHPPGDGDTIREAIDSKQREYECNRVFPFQLKMVDLGNDEDGDAITTCVVEHLEEGNAPRRKKKLTKNQKKLVEAFDQMLGEGLGKPNPGGVGFPEPGRFWVVASDDLREVFNGKYAGANPRSAFLDAFDALTGPEGPFCMASGFVWHTERRVNRRE